MEKTIEIPKKNPNFSEEHKKLVHIENDSNSVVILTEWSKEGDNFKRFTMYDNNYSPVKISSSTSLTCEI